MIERLLLALILTSCASAIPGGWVGPTPTLWVTPDAHAHSPLMTEEWLRAARVYCQRGHRCVNVELGRGYNEVRVADDVKATGFVKGDPHSLAVTRHKATKRVVYLIRHDAKGRDIKLVPHEQCDLKRRHYSARMLALHELGHFLGLGHVSDQQNVMYAKALCVESPRLP